MSLHRKCRMCDNGHVLRDHNCKKNFEGSAKAMEPKAAVKLVTENENFQECNIQLGFRISDDDSSSFAAVREVCLHEIVKHADKNHTNKGMTNELYKIHKSHKELTRDAIVYLSRCFNYAVAQNAGDAVKMAEAIRNIPHHCFNNHTDCGTWCEYKTDPENYKHSVIDSGFKDRNLFDALRCLFDILASKTNRFTTGVSSNANKSLNAIIASKAPKSR